MSLSGSNSPPDIAGANASYEKARALFAEKNYDAAIAALDDAFAKNPNHPNVLNFSGFIELTRRPRTDAQLRDARVRLRRAIDSSPAWESSALANYATALVESGREKDAVSMMEEETKRGFNKAVAHHWLGGHFAKGDVSASTRHFAEAARYEPEWGSAWVNLGLMQERMPTDVPGVVPKLEALKAYDQAAIFAQGEQRATAIMRRDRVEADLRANGTHLDKIAKSMIDAAKKANAKISATAVLLGDLGRFQRHEPFAIMMTEANGRLRAHALVVQSLMHGVCKRIVARENGIYVFRDTWTKGKRKTNDVVTDFVHSFEVPRDDRGVNPLDVACHVLSLATREVPSVLRWRLGTDLRDQKNSALEVEVENNLVAIKIFPLASGAARIDVDAIGPPPAPASFTCATFAEVILLEKNLVESIRRALAIHEAFFARPLGVKQIAPQVATLLREAGAPPPACVPSYRMGPGPALATFHYLDTELMMLYENPTSLDVKVVGGARYVAASPEELGHHMRAILAQVMSFLRSPPELDERFSEGRFYRVLAPFTIFAIGDEVKVTRTYEDHDGNYYVGLALLSDGSKHFVLKEGDPTAGGDVCAAQNQFLKRIPSRRILPEP